MLNLFPDSEPKTEGTPEKIDFALYEALMNRLLDLHAALDDGTERSAVGRLNKKILNDEPIDPQQMKLWLKNLDLEIATIHAQICLAARQAKRAS